MILKWKIRTIIATVVITVIGIVLIYAWLTADDWEEIKSKMNNLTVEQLDEIIIQPKNPNWKINLTIDTLYIKKQKILRAIVKKIKTIDKIYYPKRGKDEWSARMIIVYKNQERILFRLDSGTYGLYITFTNVWGLRRYYCNELKKYLEEYVDYKEPQGGKK